MTKETVRSVGFLLTSTDTHITISGPRAEMLRRFGPPGEGLAPRGKVYDDVRRMMVGATCIQVWEIRGTARSEIELPLRHLVPETEVGISEPLQFHERFIRIFEKAGISCAHNDQRSSAHRQAQTRRSSKEEAREPRPSGY